jgi:hypothetical protein
LKPLCAFCKLVSAELYIVVHSVCQADRIVFSV